MNFEEIFNSGQAQDESQIIKTITVDWVKHSHGILNLAKNFEPNFKIDENNKVILRLFLLYFTGNKMFNEALKELTGTEGSLNKGLLLGGGVGTGKSLLFRIIKHYTGEILHANSFQYHNASEIIDTVGVSGIEYLEQFNSNFGNPLTCYIDDIAAQNEKVNHFGTNHAVIEQLLSVRYNVYSRHKKLTHVSTNKTLPALTEIYETRIIDRMKEMFNIINLGGKSRRC